MTECVICRTGPISGLVPADHVQYARKLSQPGTSNSSMGNTTLPSIPAKRYFTIGEVAELCGVKPHVLRYWEQEFTQLRPMKRRGNRRYYQHHEVLMIRRIRDLLYDQGFTISGARNRLQELGQAMAHADAEDSGAMSVEVELLVADDASALDGATDLQTLRRELFEIRTLLSV